MASSIIGIEMGGTHLRTSRVQNGKVGKIYNSRISANESLDVILDELFAFTDQVMDASVKAIGIGVPGIVDIKKGIVHNVQNIPSWKEVHLKKYMEDRYKVPVIVNNDANCFALGEKYFGAGRLYESFIGLIAGTGLGAGVVLNGSLYSGPHCGAGEFGMVEYKDKYYEYYASGQFFKNCHQISGVTVYADAVKGDKKALAIMEEYGKHLGKAIKMILYCYDVECVILGGSVSYAYKFFQKAMWEQIRTFGFPGSIRDFKVEVSTLRHSGVLGAAGLYYDAAFSKIKKGRK